MKDFDASEVVPKALDFVKKAKSDGKLFFVWLNSTHMHLSTRLNEKWRYAAEKYTSEADLHGCHQGSTTSDLCRQRTNRSLTCRLCQGTPLAELIGPRSNPSARRIALHCGGWRIALRAIPRDRRHDQPDNERNGRD
jgi:hypothetical protein